MMYQLFIQQRDISYFNLKQFIKHDKAGEIKGSLNSFAVLSIKGETYFLNVFLKRFEL